MLNTINWAIITRTLTQGHTVTMDPSQYDMLNVGYKQVLDVWQEAGVDPDVVKWTNYYPVKDFNQLVETCVADELNIVPLRSWISCIEPGFSAPWHWDVDDNEQEYLSKGPIERYTVFIQEPLPGHEFTLDTVKYENVAEGTVIKWPKYDEWHSSVNTGTEPHYMYHILGVSRTS